jgi:hypothetical protein
MRAPTNCLITYRITKPHTQSGNPSARQSPTVQPLKYAIPLHDYNTRNIDTTVSIGKEITTTRLHTQIHTMIPPRENNPQQVRERATEALGAPEPTISMISLLDYHTRKHDNTISVITIEGYRNIDFITRLQDTQPPHPTTSPTQIMLSSHAGATLLATCTPQTNQSGYPYIVTIHDQLTTRYPATPPPVTHDKFSRQQQESLHTYPHTEHNHVHHRTRKGSP